MFNNLKIQRDNVTYYATIFLYWILIDEIDVKQKHLRTTDIKLGITINALNVET